MEGDIVFVTKCRNIAYNGSYGVITCVYNGYVAVNFQKGYGNYMVDFGDFIFLCGDRSIKRYVSDKLSRINYWLKYGDYNSAYLDTPYKSIKRRIESLKAKKVLSE